MALNTTCSHSPAHSLSRQRLLSKDRNDRLCDLTKRHDICGLERFLAKEGIDINDFVSENIQWTIIHIAAEHGSTVTVEWVMKKPGADINMKDGMRGWTALHYAARYCHVDVLRLLLSDAKILLNLRDMRQRTPLHCAARSGHCEAVSLLLEHQPAVDINACDRDLWTPLHHASFCGYSRIVSILLRDYKADPHVRNEDNKTPLHLAIDRGNKKILHTMLTCPGIKFKDFGINSEELESVTKPLPEEVIDALDDKFPVNHTRVLVLGPENSGKTCLVETLVGQDFRNTPPTDGADQMDICVQQTDNWNVIKMDERADELEQQLIAKVHESIAGSQPDYPPSSRSSSMSSTRPSRLSLIKLPKMVPSDNVSVDEVIKLLKEQIDYDPNKHYITIWDFAGQQVFNHTHGLFVSEEVVCVIVFNAAKSLDSFPDVRHPPDTLNTPKRSVVKMLSYWMQLISVRISEQASLCGNSLSVRSPTFILVGTHIDELHSDIQVANEIAYSIFAPLLREELTKMPFINHIAGSSNGRLFENSFSLFFISNINDKRDHSVIMQLKQTIVEAASIMKQMQPLKYVNMERKLLFLSQCEKTSVITLESFQCIAQDCGIALDEIAQILQHFHHRGILLHYHQVPSLAGLVILSPHWLAKLLTYVITPLKCRPAGPPYYQFAEKLRKKGLLEEKLFCWSVRQFVRQEDTVTITYEQVIDLLKGFKLIADVTKSSIAGHREVSERLFLVPHLLPVMKPPQPQSDPTFKLLYHFSNGFIPDNLVDELIVKCAEWNHIHGYKLHRLSYQCICMSFGASQTYYLQLVPEKSSIELMIVLSLNLFSEQEIAKAYKESQVLITTINSFIVGLNQLHMPAVCRDFPVCCYALCSDCEGFCATLDELRNSPDIYCKSNERFVSMKEYYTMLTTKSLDSPVQDPIKSANKVLNRYYSRLEKCLPVGDIIGKMFSENVITPAQKDEVFAVGAATQQRQTLINYLIQSVNLDSNNFCKFCQILKSLPATESLGQELWEQVNRASRYQED